MSPPSSATASCPTIDLRPAATHRSVPRPAHLEPAGAVPADGPSAFRVAGLPGSFVVHYLPELDLRTGSIGSCEALLRWQHPDFGLLRPGVTLHGSRWQDRLPGIEHWAMTEVCRQIASWEGGRLGQVAVNVSPSHLLSAGFTSSLDRALDASGIAPSKLAIDVPVALVATDPGLLRHVTGELAERGVGVVIDGVGALPSHQLLQRIPADVWKVDLRAGRNRRPGVHPAVVDVLAEARAAGVITTAKAVEDLDVLGAVRELRFDRAFGYAISGALEPAVMRDVADRGAVQARPLFGPRPTGTPWSTADRALIGG